MTLETDPFFCFHHVNAFEDERSELITLDCAAMEGGVDFGINFGNLSAAFFQRADWRASLLRLTLDLRSGQARAPAASQQPSRLSRVWASGFKKTLTARPWPAALTLASTLAACRLRSSSAQTGVRRCGASRWTCAAGRQDAHYEPCSSCPVPSLAWVQAVRESSVCQLACMQQAAAWPVKAGLGCTTQCGQ